MRSARWICSAIGEPLALACAIMPRCQLAAAILRALAADPLIFLR